MTETSHHHCTTSEIEIPVGNRLLSGFLTIPEDATGVVAFAHGSGSGRFSPRNQCVARVMNQCGLATLLLDLLAPDEEEDRGMVFDIELLADRLQLAANWLQQGPATRSLPLGYFGASTGAGAALVAAACDPDGIRAVVSRGGRPDLAGRFLPDVQAPTLLLVGGADEVVLELNEQALHALRCTKRLIVVPGATHLFPEPGALEKVAQLASKWFVDHMGSTQTPAEGGRVSQS